MLTVMYIGNFASELSYLKRAIYSSNIKYFTKNVMHKTTLLLFKLR